MDLEKGKQNTLGDVQKTAKKFLDHETAGGLVLIAATIIALIIGNSRWGDIYHHFLEDTFLFELSVHFTFGLTIEKWVNDGLMVIFFLVAGLELKRETRVGELSTFKKASMPALGALGGMIIPALIFVSINIGSKSVHGWAIPMATDIAYSLGIIGLLGKRIPSQLKVFLVALAIADDMGAIVIIALFYSKDISWLFLGCGGGVFMLLLILNQSGVKNLSAYLFGGVILWYCVLESGIHPTIAGVLLAVAIPVKPRMDSKILKERLAENVVELEKSDIETKDPMEDKRQKSILSSIRSDVEKSSPPLLRLENALTGFNAFFIIPVFALTNAAVKLNVPFTEIITDSLGLGIVLGLAVGKPLGIWFFTFLGQKLGISELEKSLSWPHILGMGMIAGIGFTMSLFITNLTFTNTEMVKDAKISILIGSFIAMVAGIITLLLTKPKKGKD